MADDEEIITLDRDGWRKLREWMTHVDRRLMYERGQVQKLWGESSEPSAWYKLESGQVLTPGGSCTAKRMEWSDSSSTYSETNQDAETIYDPHTKHFASNQCVVLCQLSPHSGRVEVLYNPRFLYRFTLNAGWSGGTADADILLSDGTDTTSDQTVRDQLSAFTDLINGDPGWCIFQDGQFHAIQAPCS